MGPNYDAPLGTTIISLPGSGVVVHVDRSRRAIVTNSLVYIIKSSFRYIKANVILQTNFKTITPN